MDKSFSTCFKKDFAIPLAFVSEKSYISLKHRVLFYNTYSKPHFEYCCIIWGNSFNSNIRKIRKLQRKACNLILGEDNTSLEDAFRQSKMLSFEDISFHKQS